MKRDCFGFSLLEVLVAFVILALTLGVMMQIFSGGLRNAAAAGEYSEAILLAESRLAELGAQPHEGETEGESGGKYRWHGTVRPWAGASEGSGADAQPQAARLMEIEVRVTWGEQDDKLREVGLNTLHLAPASGAGT